jgi:pyochelin synthetase
MNSGTLLQEIARRGLTLHADGPNLRLLGPREQMDPELLSCIKLHKPELLSTLASHAGPTGFEPSLLQRSYLLGRHGASTEQTASHVYHEFSGRWDLPRLERALNQVIAAHPALRSGFTAAGRCVVQPSATTAISITDLRRLSPSHRADALLQTRQRMSHQVLALDRPPLLAVHANLLTDDGDQLLAVGHDGLAMDGISMFLFFRAWQRAYQDVDIDLAADSVDTERYLQSLVKLRGGPAGVRSRSYWLDRLDTLPAAPELPLRAEPATVAEPRFSQQEIRLPVRTWLAIKQGAAAAELTPTAVLLTAYAEVLGYWGAERQFTLNTTLANRPPIDPAMNRSIGQYADVLLLAVDLDAAQDFTGRAAAVQARLRQDLDHRHFSGLEVLQELQRRGQGNRARMPYTFNSTLGYPDPKATGSALSGFGRELFCVSQTPQVYLNVFVMEQDGELVIQLDALDGVFPDGLIDALAGGYRRLLGALAEPQTWSAADPELLPAEQAAVRAAVNDTATLLSDDFAWQAFLRRANETPQAPAVLTAHHSLSYGELAARATELASWLREQGVQRNELVGLVMRRGPEQLVAVLAVALAGAAYLPVDAGLPAHRQAYMLADGGVRQVLTNVMASVGEGITVRRIDLDAPVPATASDSWAPLPGAEPTDLLYVLYTSGTTGEPKGVMISHRSVVNLVDDCTKRFSVSATDRFFGISAFNFDLSVYDIFGALSTGAAVVLPDHDSAADPAHWLQLCAQHGVTLWNSVPAIVTMLREQAVQVGLAGLSTLRLVMMSGDRIPVELPRSLRQLVPHTELISLGGPTETTVWNILHPISEADLLGDHIPYGRPNSNNRCYVLDERGRQRPDGVVGEICAAGFGVAQGYWRDPERTAHRFFQHAGLGERIYCTGDLGRYRSDGTVVILGRKDFQIKINGYRIEAGEVEARLAEIDGIDAAAVVRNDGELGSRLVGHLAGPAEDRPGDEAIRDRLRLTLPDYMVPVSLRWHEQLPLTGNNKVDRATLAAMPVTVDHGGRQVDEQEPPSGELERQLLELWSRTLHTPVTDPQLGFYDLGGSSLAAAQVLTQVRKQFGAAIPLDEFYLVDRVRSMARRIEADPRARSVRVAQVGADGTASDGSS